MKRVFFLRLFTFIYLLCNISIGRAQPVAGNNRCFPGSSYAITSLTADDFSDLRFLKKIVSEKRIVLIGESSHGIGDYYSLKARLVKFLHQECGFEILSLESGIADVFTEYQKTDTISARSLRNNTVFGNFQCKEILPLFDYIKQTYATPKPLIYSGFDSQNFSSSLRLLRLIMKELRGRTGDSLVNNLEKYYKIPSLLWQEDRAPLFALADTIKSAAKEMLQFVQSNKPLICQQYKLSDLSFRFLLRALSNHIESVSLNWNTEDPSAKRDSIMAGNLFWLMDEIYPNKKVIVWAHNGHIGKKSTIGNPYKWLGQYVRERFGKSAFHIGLFAREGETFEWWTKTTKPFNNNQSNDIENLSAVFENTFIGFGNSKRCSWATKKTAGFELENGGSVEFVPAERFDAVITIKKAAPPDYH